MTRSLLGSRPMAIRDCLHVWIWLSFPSLLDWLEREKGYIGAGGSGRNTTIIRANYRTPEGVAFYKEALRLYEQHGFSKVGERAGAWVMRAQLS